MTDAVIHQIWDWSRPPMKLYRSRVYDTLWGFVDENGTRLVLYFGTFHPSKGRPRVSMPDMME